MGPLNCQTATATGMSQGDGNCRRWIRKISPGLGIALYVGEDGALQYCAFGVQLQLPDAVILSRSRGWIPSTPATKL